MPILSGSGGGSTLSGVTVTGTAAAGQVPVATSAAAGTWKYPPGFEIGYTQITGTVNVASTTEATGTTIISPGALTFDGGLVLCHFSGHMVSDTAAAGDFLVVSLFEAATQISRLCLTRSLITATNNEQPISGFFRFTPTAAAHTYTVTAFATSTTGTPGVLAGAGGTGGNSPAFVRFTKV